MSTSLQADIAAANRRDSLGRQKCMAKKTWIKKTEAELVDMLCDRATDAAAAFYKNEMDMRTTMKALQDAVSIAQKRLRELRGML